YLLPFLCLQSGHFIVERLYHTERTHQRIGRLVLYGRRSTPMIAEAICVHRRSSAAPYLGAMRSLASGACNRPGSTRLGTCGLAGSRDVPIRPGETRAGGAGRAWG